MINKIGQEDVSFYLYQQLRLVDKADLFHKNGLFPIRTKITYIMTFFMPIRNLI